jgi:hypothetical protein
VANVVYLSTGDVVRALRDAGYPLPENMVSARVHVARLANAGEINHVRTKRGHFRYKPDDVRDFILQWQDAQELLEPQAEAEPA